MWFAIAYWIGSCLHYQAMFMVITILLKPKPEAVLYFLLKRELKSLYEILLQSKFFSI